MFTIDIEIISRLGCALVSFLAVKHVAVCFWSETVQTGLVVFPLFYSLKLLGISYKNAVDQYSVTSRSIDLLEAVYLQVSEA